MMTKADKLSMKIMELFKEIESLAYRKPNSKRIKRLQKELKKTKRQRANFFKKA